MFSSQGVVCEKVYDDSCVSPNMCYNWLVYDHETLRILANVYQKVHSCWDKLAYELLVFTGVRTESNRAAIEIIAKACHLDMYVVYVKPANHRRAIDVGVKLPGCNVCLHISHLPTCSRKTYAGIGPCMTCTHCDECMQKSVMYYNFAVYDISVIRNANSQPVHLLYRDVL